MSSRIDCYSTHWTIRAHIDGIAPRYAPSLSRFHFSMFLVTFCWFVPARGIYSFQGRAMTDK